MFDRAGNFQEVPFSRRPFVNPSPLFLRQEIDGPQAKQLELVPCGQKLRNSRKEEKLSPAQVRDRRPHISHS